MVQKRFIRRGVAKIYYIPTVAAPGTGPTRTEIAAGTDLTDWTSEIAGFQVTSDSVETPDMGSRFTSSIPGATSVGDSSITFYDDEEAEDIDTLFPIGDEGYVYFMRKGDKPATPTGDLFPTRVASKTPNWTTDMTGATTQVTFNVTSEPYVDLAIPAAT